MKGYRHDKHTRADLAADWKSGVLCYQAYHCYGGACFFGTSPYLVKRVLEQRGHLPKRPKVPAIEAAWSKTTVSSSRLSSFGTLMRCIGCWTAPLPS